jgi:hypothetical protein
MIDGNEIPKANIAIITEIINKKDSIRHTDGR